MATPSMEPGARPGQAPDDIGALYRQDLSHVKQDKTRRLVQQGQGQPDAALEIVAATASPDSPPFAIPTPSEVKPGDGNEAISAPGDESQPTEADAPYSALPEVEKICLLLASSFAAIISPFSTGIYYPSVNALSRDLGVSISLINLTISTYQVFQGIAPSVTAAISDTYGRRPAYLLCFIIYFGANLGLALQDGYAALLVLRCIQSSGSSGTVVLGQAVVSDLATRAERGKYIAYATIGYTLGPALGPVVGGLLSQYLHWRAIFWFLLILCSVLASVMFIFFRETSRSIVGNGSVPPPKWNRSLLQMIRPDSTTPEAKTLEKRRPIVNPFRSVLILGDRESCIIIMYGGLLYAGYASVSSVLSSQLYARYGFNEVQIGLCYIPIGIGSLSSRWTTALLIDWNFKREAKKQGLPIVKNRQQDISNFNIERARLAMAFPMILAGCCFILAYGWLMEYRTPLAAVLVVLFFIANVLTGCLVAHAALLTDINRESAASAGAAINLVRCLLGAGGVAAATPLIDAIGIGPTATLTAGLWIVTAPALWSVYRHGHRWRIAKAAKRKKKEESPGDEPAADQPT